MQLRSRGHRGSQRRDPDGNGIRGGRARVLVPREREWPARSAAQEAAADVGYVEDVSGRVVAFAQGKPTLLDALDVISDRTRLDLQANSELRICHYPTAQASRP